MGERHSQPTKGKTARSQCTQAQTASRAGFGGISGFELGADGKAFVAISDTGLIYRGALQRDSADLITDATLSRADKLMFENGGYPDKKRNRDTEGLAISPSGTTFISAESKTRLLTYAAGKPNAQIRTLPKLDPKTPTNMGFEALALSQEGHLFAIAEGSPNIRAPFRLYKRDGSGEWQAIFDLKRSGGFRPVGADFGPDAHLYVLTRAFNGFGFASRIVRVRFENAKPVAQENIYASRFGQFDNLEGLSVWSATPNDLRVYAISDDNFNRAQTTQIVEFRAHE